MNDENEKTSLLDSVVSNSRTLNELVEYTDDSIVSKTIFDKKVGTITLFAFDKGQKLSEHQSPYDAVVQVIDGSATLTISGEEKTACAGQIIIMPGNIPHAVDARERFKMLLTMIRS